MSYASYRRGLRRQRKGEKKGAIAGAIIGLLTGGIGGFLKQQNETADRELRKRKIDLDAEDSAHDRALKELGLQYEGQRTEAYAEEKRAAAEKARRGDGDSFGSLTKDKMDLLGAHARYGKLTDDELNALIAELGGKTNMLEEDFDATAEEQIGNLSRLMGVRQSPFAGMLSRRPGVTQPGTPQGAEPEQPMGTGTTPDMVPGNRDQMDRQNLLRSFYTAFNPNSPPEQRVAAWGYLQRFFPEFVPQAMRDQFQGAGR